MTSGTTRLPLFEKDQNADPSSDARLCNPDTFEDDVELSLTRKGSMRKAWGNTAGRMFVKAKAGVDALRNNRSQQLQDEERCSTPTMREGAESVMRGPPPRASTFGRSQTGLRATASLNRVLDTAKRATKRNSVFSSTGLTNATSASEPPKGPEEYDDGSLRSSTSSKRPSLSSIRQWTKSPSSKHSSPLSKQVRASIDAVRRSNDSGMSSSTMSLHSPNAVTRHSPPPSITCDLQMIDFLDSTLMEAVGLSQADFAASLSSDSLASATASTGPGLQAEDQHQHQVYLPSRGTNDHWRTSKARVSSLNSRAPHTLSASDESLAIGSLLDLDKLLMRDGDVGSQHDKEIQSIAGRSSTEPNVNFDGLRPGPNKAEASRSQSSSRAPVVLDSRTAPATDFASLLSSMQERAAKGARKGSRPHTPRTSASPPPAYTGANEQGSPVQRIKIDVSRTPSPGKTLKLPLRPKQSARSKGEQPPVVGESPAASEEVRQTQSRSRVSSDELGSPLLTQDLFFDSDDDNHGYALGLNDLVEKATRIETSASVEEKVGTPTVGRTGTPESAAFKTLSDLKRMRPFREQMVRGNSPFLSPKKSTELREMIDLEREAVTAVFPAIGTAIGHDTQANTHDKATLALPEGELIQDKNLKHRVDELFFGGVQGSGDTTEGTGSRTSDKLRVSSNAASANSGSTGMGCQICGGIDDHICEVLSPSMVVSSSAASVSSTEHESACPRPAPMPSQKTTSSTDNRQDPVPESKHEEMAISPSNNLAKIQTCSLQRKKSDPLGLELHRLGNQAAEWLQCLSGDGVKRYVPSMMREARPERVPLSWMRRSTQSPASPSNLGEAFSIVKKAEDKENREEGESDRGLSGGSKGEIHD